MVRKRRRVEEEGRGVVRKRRRVEEGRGVVRKRRRVEEGRRGGGEGGEEEG